MRNWWILEYHLSRYDDGVDDDDVAAADHIQTPQLTNLSPLCLGFCLTKVAMIATEVRQPTIPRAILRRFTFYSIRKTIKSQGYHTYKALSPQPDRSSLLHHHRAHHAVPTPPALGRHFWFQIHFQRGNFSFCAAKSMDDLSLAFRNLHKLHNSRSSVNYLDVAAWTCAWKDFSRSLFKLNF